MGRISLQGPPWGTSLGTLWVPPEDPPGEALGDDSLGFSSWGGISHVFFVTTVWYGGGIGATTLELATFERPPWGDHPIARSSRRRTSGETTSRRTVTQPMINGGP